MQTTKPTLPLLAQSQSPSPTHPNIPHSPNPRQTINLYLPPSPQLCTTPTTPSPLTL